MTTSILKEDIHSIIARSFYNGVINRTTSAYFFLGKTIPWDEFTDTPIDATQTYEDEYNTRNNTISLRRVLDTEISFAIDKQDWVANRVYDMYDPSYSVTNVAPSGATSLVKASIYVITDEFNIYKCISNNYGSPSTVKPTGNSLSFISLADGYVWKYMMPVSILSQGRFMSGAYMPIQNSITDNFYSPGVTPVLVNGGTGYVEGNTLLQIVGDGANAKFEPVIDTVTGEITNINVINAGSGYTNASVVVSSPNPLLPQGSGAVIEIDLNVGDLSSSQSDVQLSAVDGELSFIYLENAGSGFTNATVTLSGDGSGATASATILNGSISSIQIGARGVGYTYATITISGDGVNASARSIISPVGGHGNNIIEESFSDILAFYMDTTEDIRQGFRLTNDYRQAGIIINPDQYTTGGSRRLYINDRAGACWVAGFDSLSQSVLPDEIITRSSDNVEFVVIQSKSEDNKIMIQNLTAAGIEVGDSFKNENDVHLFEVTSIITPEIDKFSGSLLYYDNKSAYREKLDQNVILKTYIKF